ncbi:MAG TPA: hypothetical protein VIH99_00105 [Bdellovibrionota bacterium]|jgi:hypothetical protein
MTAAIFLATFLNSASTFAATHIWFQPWSSTHELADVLASVPEGRAVLDAAKKVDPHFLDLVEPDNSSFTENTVAGTYKPFEGDGGRLRQKTKIHLKRKLPLSDAAADLSHELLHFAKRKLLDPFEGEFELKKYVLQGIEGEGGELEAFENECKVAAALEKSDPAFPRHRYCERYSKDGIFQKEKARSDYYALGKWMPNADTALKTAFPSMNDQPVAFSSGMSGKPYPISFAEEFARARKAACETNRWRFRVAAEKTKRRKHAVADMYIAELEKIRGFHTKNCRGIPLP